MNGLHPSPLCCMQMLFEFGGAAFKKIYEFFSCADSSLSFIEERLHFPYWIATESCNFAYHEQLRVAIQTIQWKLCVLFIVKNIQPCGEPAISLHSHHVSLVSWTTRLLPVMRDPGSIPRGVPMWNWDSPVSVVLLHGDPDVMQSLVSLPFSGCFTRLRADNVKSQRLHCPSVGASLGFAPTMCKPTWSHTALLSRFHAVCRLHNQQSQLLGGGALWRACNLTSFTPCLTGPVDYPFASCHEGPGFNSQGGTCVKLGYSPVSVVSLQPYHSYPRVTTLRTIF
jgi:hypothetical protein